MAAHTLCGGSSANSDSHPLSGDGTSSAVTASRPTALAKPQSGALLQHIALHQEDSSRAVSFAFSQINWGGNRHRHMVRGPLASPARAGIGSD